MPDRRLSKLAEILVHYSLEIKPGDQFELRSNPLAHDLALLVYQEAIKAGAYVTNYVSLPGGEEVFYKYANDDQLDFVSPVRKLVTESFDVILSIGAEYNTRSLSAVDPQRLSRARKARTQLTKIFLERSAKKELRWCYTVFPTNASAQDADMSLADYQEFVYGAGLLDEPDPISATRKRETHILGILLRNPDLVYHIDRNLQEDGLQRISEQDFMTTDHQVLIQLLIKSLDQNDSEPLDYVLNHLNEMLMNPTDSVLKQTEGIDPYGRDILEDILRTLLLIREQQIGQQLDHLRFLQEAAQENGDLKASEYQDTMVNYVILRGRLHKAKNRYTHHQISHK